MAEMCQPHSMWAISFAEVEFSKGMCQECSRAGTDIFSRSDPWHATVVYYNIKHKIPLQTLNVQIALTQ